MSAILEIACFTIDGALRAAASGANRIELCENPHEGGTTPSYGTLKKIRSLIHVPVFPIIRPRGGDFCYSSYELDVQLEDISICRSLGYEGIVIGMLSPSGDIDADTLARFVERAYPMQVTFHRAFDRCKDPFAAIDTIIGCGCHRILTSGQYPSVEAGMLAVASYVQYAANRICIMPGSGLNSRNIKQIALTTQATEFHTAARIVSNLVFHSPDTMQEQLQFTTVNEDEVKQLRFILDKLYK